MATTSSQPARAASSATEGVTGYLASSGGVFACYGKQDDASPSVPEILKKMETDYEKACEHLKTLVKAWLLRSQHVGRDTHRRNCGQARRNADR